MEASMSIIGWNYPLRADYLARVKRALTSGVYLGCLKPRYLSPQHIAINYNYVT